MCAVCRTRTTEDRETCRQRERARAAESVAKHRYPGPVGQYLAEDLREWADHGYRIGPSVKIRGVVDQLLGHPAATAGTSGSAAGQ